MRTEEGEVDLVVDGQVELVVAAEGSAVHAEDDDFVGVVPADVLWHYILREYLWPS